MGNLCCMKLSLLQLVPIVLCSSTCVANKQVCREANKATEVLKWKDYHLPDRSWWCLFEHRQGQGQRPLRCQWPGWWQTARQGGAKLKGHPEIKARYFKLIVRNTMYSQAIIGSYIFQYKNLLLIIFLLTTNVSRRWQLWEKIFHRLTNRNISTKESMSKSVTFEEKKIVFWKAFQLFWTYSELFCEHNGQPWSQSNDEHLK